MSRVRAVLDAFPGAMACQYRNKSPLRLSAPVYVKACENSSWHLQLVKKSTGEAWNSVFRCRSWRHDGDCRLWKGSQDFVRIRDALKKHDGWVYMVLTFERDRDVLSAYREIVDCWDRLRKRLVRAYGKTAYIALIEQHRDGYPHVNVVVHNQKFVEEARRDWKALRRLWNRAVVECGFGMRFWLEPVRSEEAMAGYYVKLVGEMGKKSQVPVLAPSHFRRLRASRGLLPKCYKNEDITGVLVTEKIPEEYAWDRLLDVEAMKGVEDVVQSANSESYEAGTEAGSETGIEAGAEAARVACFCGLGCSKAFTAACLTCSERAAAEKERIRLRLLDERRRRWREQQCVTIS